MRISTGKKRCMMMVLMGIMLSVSWGTIRTDAASKTAKVAGITYKVANQKKKTAVVVKSAKNVKKVVVADEVKIKGKVYKVTGVSKNAFRKRTKLQTVILGSNIRTISANAFYGDKKLRNITIVSVKMNKIGSQAWKGISKKAIFYVPKQKYKAYSKLIRKKRTGWKKTMKITPKSLESLEEEKDKEEDNRDNTVKEGKYSYSISPMTDGICYMFYVKTDNPDPKSFDFVDESTKMTESGTATIQVCSKKFADVDYTDDKTLRVKEGYIFYGSSTDGGQIRLQVRDGRKMENTNQVLTLPAFKSVADYLIDEYTNPNMAFFEKMNAVENGFNSICLYSGAYIQGTLHKSTTSPYYGLSTSPHVDQTFYIQDPYYRTDSQALLTSYMYPFIADSIGFPSVMASVAKKLDSSASVKWNSSLHWLVDVTYNGETKSYGGAGNGGGQAITADLIRYRYTFDGSAADAANVRSFTELSKRICEYGAMSVPEEPKDLPELTWEQVTDTVGTEGSYVRLVLINSIFGGGGIGYSFLYKQDNSTYPGYFSDAWYDGRYFNSHEFFEKGTSFTDEWASTSDIIVKDVKIPFPEDTDNVKYYYQYNEIGKIARYNAQTGVWSGFTRYRYDKDSDTWIADVYQSTRYQEKNNTGYNYKQVDDATYKKACTLTREQVKAMQIDRNKDVDPSTYYIYDMTVQPGTKVTGE